MTFRLRPKVLSSILTRADTLANSTAEDVAVLFNELDVDHSGGLDWEVD